MFLTLGKQPESGSELSPVAITTAMGKLRPRFYGPYKILAVINEVAYRLELPPRARIHDLLM